MENYKSNRVLSLYSKLLKGEAVNKAQEAKNFEVTQKSIQRDINEIRTFIQQNDIENGFFETVVYDKSKKGYVLNKTELPFLTKSEIFAVCKILLESRSLVKLKMESIIDKLLKCCISEEDSEVISKWDMGVAVKEQRVMKIEYEKLKNSETVKRIIQPVGILFSEFYFYLVGFIQNIDKEKEFKNKDDIFPTIYRVDRIKNFEVTNEKFSVPYKDRFEEGEFRKRIQFMWGGRLRQVKFKYKGISVEAVCDRLPTAEIIKEENGVYWIKAEVFGDGIYMWLRSQGNDIELMED